MSALLTDADLAERIGGVSAEQVAIWRRTYDWPCVKFGRQVRYTPEQVEAIVAKHTTDPKAKKAAAPTLIEGQTKRSARRSA